jgi:hypothetical protein
VATRLLVGPDLVIRTLAAAVVVGYLPGALVFRLPYLNRPARAGLSAEERGFWAVVLSACWSLGWVLMLAWPGVYSFERLLGVNLATSALLLGVWRGRLRFAGTAPHPSWTVIAPALLVAAGVFVFFPPAEYVIGGKDPGVYVSEGVQIALRGALVVPDPVVASIPAEFRELFFPDHQNPDYYSLRFMGFWIPHGNRDTVVGQFPQFLPASMALGYSLAGVSGALGTIGLWATLGLLAVYFTGARLFGCWPAFGAAMLLAANVIEVWFGRYPNAELVMQPLVFAALLAFARALEGSQGFFGAVAAVLLALGLFLRIEMVVAVAAFVAAAMLAPIGGRRVGLTFGLALVGVSTVATAYLIGPMWAHTRRFLAFAEGAGGWWLAVVAVVAFGLSHLLLRASAVADAVRRFLPPVTASAAVGLGFYAYFLRASGGGLADHDAYAFRMFGWYVPPVVMGMAVIGYAVLTVRQFWRDPAFFLTVLTFSTFVFYKIRIVPEHFWMTRRFAAVALPGMLLLAMALVHHLTNGSRLAGAWARARGGRSDRAGARWRAAGAVVLAAVALPIGVTFWRASDPVHRHVEYRGLRQRVEQLAARIGDRDLLIVEGRNGDSDVHTFALPLAYVYQRQVVVLPSAVPPKRQLEGFLDWARSQYAEVYFLGGGGTDLLSQRIAAEPIASEQFTVPEYASTENAYPVGVRQKEFEFGLYRLRASTGIARGPIDLTIGTRDDLHTVRFHSKEGRPGTSLVYRWTRRLSYVVLLGIAPDARTLTIWMSNGNRPATAPAPVVEVTIDDQLLGRATVGSVLQPYEFALPADLVAAAAVSPDPKRVALRVPTWNPAAAGDGPDERDLGVIVTRVQVQ